jgi:hypothetical protein
MHISASCGPVSDVNSFNKDIITCASGHIDVASLHVETTLVEIEYCYHHLAHYTVETVEAAGTTLQRSQPYRP